MRSCRPADISSRRSHFLLWEKSGRKIINMQNKQFHIFFIRAVNRFIPWFPERVSVIGREDFIEQAKKYQNMPYVLGWDGNRENGIDCSHLVCISAIDAWGAKPHFHRTAHDLLRLSKLIRHDEIVPGDLVFWETAWRMEHVAIVLQKNHDTLEIIDASGPSTGLWSTTVREIRYSTDLIFGRPPFFSKLS